MKNVFAISKFLLVSFCLMFLTAGKSYAGWHELTQASRNQAIIDRTAQDNTHYVGQNCKDWVRTVVYSASGGLVSIPATHPNLYTWYPDSNVVGRSGLVQYAQPGEIVQMKLTSGLEHTAIVLAVSPTGITFIESNWQSQTHPNTVYTRYVTFTTFYGQVSAYSIYFIL